MACFYCGAENHDIRNCRYAAKRKPFPKGYKYSKRCQCCGQYGYDIQLHHSRGRGDNHPDVALEMCVDCHLQCGHDGSWQNLPIKPAVCRILGRRSYWR